MGVRMFNFLIWLIERFDLFHGFEETEILRSFNSAFSIVSFFVFVISLICLICLVKYFSKPDGISNITALDGALFSLLGSAIISCLACLALYHIYNPQDPESLIKTTQIKDEQTVIIPSEGVTATSLKLKDSDSELQPSSLKDGDMLTLSVTVENKEFKREFPYKKENFKIKKGKSEKVTSAVLKTRSFKDELFKHERIRDEEDVLIEMETLDPFYNSEN